jgi:hypothetical protein
LEITVIIAIGIDLAKTVFAVHGVGESSKRGQDDAADQRPIVRLLPAPQQTKRTIRSSKPWHSASAKKSSQSASSPYRTGASSY